MLLDILPNALGLALGKRFTLDGGILANRVMVFYFLIGQHFLAAQRLIVADKLHALKLLFDLFFHADESRFAAHHGALACFFCELV